jgi:hypothetical protein
MSSIRGRRVARIEAHIPSAGQWIAHAILEVGGVPEPGPAEVRIANLTLQGTVLPTRRGLDGPDQPTCVVLGGAGWRTLLPREGKYASPVGVRLLTVLEDLAGLAGEPYDAPSDVLLDSAYGWSAATSSAPRRARGVLDDLVARGALPTWRMTPAGRTVFSAWPPIGPADGIARVLSRRLSVGQRKLGLDTRAAALLPGATLEGDLIRRTILIDTGGSLTAEVWT